MAKKSKPAPKATKKAAPKAKTKAKAKKPMPKAAKGKVVLLSGGNPQIPKGYGEGPIKAYLAAMPGWKQSIGKAIDKIIDDNVPGVKKAVKWNTPMYGLEDDHFFLGFHCFDRYVKVTFFRGTQLTPQPPETSKWPDVRYANVHEGKLDKAQMTSWVKQAAALPGAKM